MKINFQRLNKRKVDEDILNNYRQHWNNKQIARAVPEITYLLQHGFDGGVIHLHMPDHAHCYMHLETFDDVDKKTMEVFGSTVPRGYATNLSCIVGVYGNGEIVGKIETSIDDPYDKSKRNDLCIVGPYKTKEGAEALLNMINEGLSKETSVSVLEKICRTRLNLVTTQWDNLSKVLNYLNGEAKKHANSKKCVLKPQQSVADNGM